MNNGMTKARELKLIKLAARGDLDAATELIRTHQGAVYSFIRRQCGRDDIAEDTTQEAFKRVLLNLDRFDPKYRFSTWLFTIARRIMLNIVAKMQPVYDSDRLCGAAVKDAPVGTKFEDDEVNRRDLDLLQRALMALSPQQREIVALHHQLEWPIWLVAAQLGIPEGTVKSHLSRGRIRLRDEFLRIEAMAEQAKRVALSRAGRAVAKAKSVAVNAKSSIMVAVDDPQPADLNPATGSQSTTRAASAKEGCAIQEVSP